MLTLEVEFLTGQMFAADYRNRNHPEWPPHPDRLFSALVAASYETDLVGSSGETLAWLARQGAPAINCSDATERGSCKTFVPVNDAKKDFVLPTRRTRRPRTFPCAVPERATVYFIWSFAEPTAEQLVQLQRVAENVTYLGSSRSLVRVAVCADSPPPNLIPDDAGELVLRISGSQRLAELNELYHLGRRPTPGLLQPYRRVKAVTSREDTVYGGVFGDFLVFRFAQWPRVPLEATLALAEALRKAVLSIAGDQAPESLHGHSHQTHCAWVPLPFVAHPKADGHLVGCAVLLPRGLPSNERRAILGALGRLQKLTLPDGRALALQPAGADPRTTLWRRTWTQPSPTWTTITPMVLDRFPRAGRPGREIQDIIATACHNLGYETPVSVDASPYSPLHGVPPSARFRIRRRFDDALRPYTHVTLRFQRPVRGPLLLGAGRYFGLGLFRPLKTGDS